MIFVNDFAGQNIYTGPEWTDLTGQVTDDALGRNWMRKIHHEDRALVEDTRSEAIEATCEYVLRFRIMKPDGSFRWIASGVKPALSLPDQDVVGFRGSVAVLSDGPIDDMKASGSVGQFALRNDEQFQTTDDYLDRIAHHIISATALIKQYGIDAALPGAQSALFHVAQAIARRQTRSNRLQ